MKEIFEYRKSDFDVFKLNEKIGENIEVKGVIHRLRILKQVAFVILRMERSLIQGVIEPENFDKLKIQNYKEGDFVKIYGKVREAKLKDLAVYPRSIEIEILKIDLIHRPYEEPPFEINKKELNVKFDTEFNYRMISLRHPKKRAVLKILETVANVFEQYFTEKGFTRIFSPKIVFAGAEGGANIFKIKYFDKELYLAQSPQFYKQYGVGIYGRVFEIGPVFRAEKHYTSRHLNEYISLDIEMGFIDSFYDVMEMETGFLKRLFNEELIKRNAFEIELLKIEIPEIEKIPSIKFKEAHELYFKYRKKDVRNEPDLDPDEERFLTWWAKNEFNSDFLFVTHFPTRKRPFYTMDDPEDPDYTLSFDLLFRGIEITTGGQRIHDYKAQVEKLKKFNLNPENFESYLMLHKYGVPPHGGFAIGLERLTARICNIQNVKEASMFPRDVNRYIP